MALRRGSQHTRAMPKGPQGQKRPADPNQLAKLIVDIVTGEAKDTVDPRGRAGGLSGGKAQAEKLTLEARRKISRRAATRRWKGDTEGS